MAKCITDSTAAGAALVLDRGTKLVDIPAGVVLLQSREPLGPDIERELLYTLYNGQQQLSRRLLAFEMALTESALRGSTLAEVLQLGAAQLARAIYLLDPHGRIIDRFTPPGQSPAQVPHPALPVHESAPGVVVREGRQGDAWYVASRVDGTKSASWDRLAVAVQQDADDLVVRHTLARLAVAAVALGQRQTPDERARLVGLLFRATLPAEERAKQAALLQLDPERAFLVLHFGSTQAGTSPTDPVRAIREWLLDSTVRIEPFTVTNGVASGVLLHAAGNERAALAAAPARLRRGLATLSPGYLVAYGAPERGLSTLPEWGRRARFALALLHAGLIPGPIVDCGDVRALGAYAALFPLWGKPTSAAFAAATLGELVRGEEQQAHDLAHTILAYVQHGGNIGAAAKALAIHRNTLKNRLHQIERLSGLTPDEPHQLSSLFVAALLWTLPADEHSLD